MARPLPLLSVLLATIPMTLAGCFGCEFFPGPEPHPAPGVQGLRSGAWSVDIHEGRLEGRCEDIEAEAIELEAFIERRGDGGLTIELDGVVLDGRQRGSEVFATGALAYDEPSDPPRPGRDDDEAPETDEDGCSDGSEGEGSEGGAPPPCAPRQEDEDRPAPADRPAEGVVVDLEGWTDEPTWMEGELSVALIQRGQVRCTLRAPFEAWFVGPGHGHDDDPEVVVVEGGDEDEDEEGGEEPPRGG